MSRSGILWVALAAFVIGGCSKTEGTNPEPVSVGAGGAGADVRSDSDFVQDMALKSMASVELSRMALEKATDPNVKIFAQQMIDEHGKVRDGLKSVVSGHPIEWPAQLDEDHRETIDEVAQKQGADFDRAYVEAIVEAHQNLAAKLESRLDVQSLAEWKTAAAARTESKALPDPEVAMRDVAVRPNNSDSEFTMKINQWAADTYPVAQKHLDTARRMETATEKRSNN